MKIYDAFILDDELDLLGHHLAEVYDLVDVIVLVEAAETFTGHTKPLHFRENRVRFAWASAKLQPISLPKLPGASSWEREAFQRNAIQLGLSDAQPEDLVLLLDVDEVPSRSVLERLRSDGLDRPHRLSMTRHYGRLDLLAPRSACCPSPQDPFPHSPPRLRPASWSALQSAWFCAPGVAATVRDLRGDVAAELPPRSPNELRRATTFAPRLSDAGRHLSSLTSTLSELDGVEALRTKLSHVSHTEYADSRSLAAEHLRRTRRYAIHARGWWFAEPPAGPLPDDLQRLKARLGTSASLTPRTPLLRRLVRTWAWLRHRPNLPEGVARFVDLHFELLLPVLFPVLLTADGIRSLAARWQKQEPSAQTHMH